jgi:long-chain fatty acid transport protein
MRAESRFLTRVARAASGVVLFFVARDARAGGFEFPDNGTEALGRGATFTAKADSPLAVYYNVAGLARQRGTNVLIDGNLNFHSFTFQRTGTYPDNSNDPATPWGGSNFPAVTDASGPFYAPFVAVTSDFGYFDRLTFALAAFGPSAVGGRTFQLGVQGAPGPGRYDAVQSESSIIYPTLAAAYRVTPWLDLGVGASLVVASFDTTSVAFSAITENLCPQPEYYPCDSRSELKTNGTGFAPSFGALVRPSESFAFGVNVRAAHELDTSGSVTAVPPLAAAAIPIAPGDATLKINLPWVVRAGARYIAMKNAQESFDIELDATYETWAQAQGSGPEITIPKLGPYSDIHTVLQHGYKDTFSVRGGGAYNMDALSGTLAIRGGAYYDSSATDFQNTRIDFDTLAKVGVTAGVGYKNGPVTVNFALAEVFDLDRVVADGTIRPIDPAQHGASVDGNGQLLPAVNNGAYTGHMHVLSFGVTLAIDRIFGFDRKVAPMNDYESAEPFKPEEKKEEKKPEEKKDEGDDATKKKDSDTPKWEDSPKQQPSTWKPSPDKTPISPDADTPRPNPDDTSTPPPKKKKKPKKRPPPSQ